MPQIAFWILYKNEYLRCSWGILFDYKFLDGISVIKIEKTLDFCCEMVLDGVRSLRIESSEGFGSVSRGWLDVSQGASFRVHYSFYIPYERIGVIC